MTDGALTLLMLLVSWTSLLLQGAALAHLMRQRAACRAERLAGGGYVRTAASRVAAACVYVAVAVLQATGTHIPGSGGVTPEALVVLSAVQLLWIVNSALDVRVRRRLRQQDEGSDHGGAG